MRAAYILADVPICTLLVSMMIDYEGWHDVPIALKERALMSTTAGEQAEPYVQFRVMHGQVQAIRCRKDKSRAAIVAVKQYERYVEALFASYWEEKLGIVQNMGLSQLRPLLLNDTIMHYRVDEDSPEKADNDHVPASELLQMLGDRHDREQGATDITFILPGELVSANDRPVPLLPFDEAYAATPFGDDSCPEPWIDLLFELPSLNPLEATELQAIRSQLSVPGTPFRQAFDAWVKGCVHDGWNSAQAARHYAGSVRPAATALRQAMDQNRVLAHTGATSGDGSVLKVYACCMPLRALWAFWRNARCIADDTFEILQATDDARGGILVPALAVALWPIEPNSIVLNTQEDEGAKGEPDAEAPPPASARRTLEL